MRTVDILEKYDLPEGFKPILRELLTEYDLTGNQEILELTKETIKSLIDINNTQIDAFKRLKEQNQELHAKLIRFSEIYSDLSL
jgi:hypothetical protein